MRAKILALGSVALALGCSGSTTGRAAAGRTTPGATSTSTSTNTTSATLPTAFATAANSTEFTIVDATPDQVPASVGAVELVFSRAVDARTVRMGSTVFAAEDRDTNEGGTFDGINGTVTLDATKTRLTFKPSAGLHVGREMRVILTYDVLSTLGERLVKGNVSSPISFRQSFPRAVFELRTIPVTKIVASAGTTTSQAPSTFKLEPNTDPWHIDFAVKASQFAQDMDSHGMLSGDAATDELMRQRLAGLIASYCGQKYGRTADGRSVLGKSFRISFTIAAPTGTPGRQFSREAVGGKGKNGSTVLGVSQLDPGNRWRNDNATASLGIFPYNIHSRRGDLRPPLAATDKKYLDGSYKLGAGTPSEDRRFVQVRECSDDLAHGVGSVLAHEVGHSVGLSHDDSDSMSIMRTATNAALLSDKSSRFDKNSVAVLEKNLGRTR